MHYFRALKITDSILIPVSASAVLIYLYLAYPYGSLWDMSVYLRAISDLSKGIDPYRINAGLPFVYHPLVLDSFAFLNRIAPLKAWLLVLYAMSSGWFVMEVMKWLRTNAHARTDRQTIREDTGWRASGCASLLSAAAFGGVGIVSIQSGNMTAFMHFALIAAFLRRSRSSELLVRNFPFILIAVLSVIKPYFLAYLLIPASLHESNWKKVQGSALTIATFLLLWMPSRYFSPEAYSSYIGALHYQMLDLGDVGYSFFMFYRRVVHNDLIALTLHGITACAALIMAVKVLPKKLETGENEGLVIFLLYSVLTLASPRMKEYDFFPAIICFFLFLKTVSGEAGTIVLIGLVFSWIPLMLSVLGTLGIAFHRISGASTTWQFVGLAAVVMTFVFANSRPRIIRA